MTARVLSGESQESLMADLAARPVLTSYGNPWTYAGLKQVLLRPFNAGLIEHCGVIVAELPGEPLISREDHDRLVAMYAARRRGRPQSPRYLCTGSAFCGRCDHKLYGRPRYVRPYPDGTPRREYWCSPSGGGCGRLAVNWRGLDELAAALAIEVLGDPRHAQQIEAAAAKHAETASQLDAQISADEELALTIADRLGRREISLDRHDAIMGPLDARLAGLRAQREALNDPGSVPAAGIDWGKRWRRLSLPSGGRCSDWPCAAGS